MAYQTFAEMIALYPDGVPATKENSILMGISEVEIRQKNELYFIMTQTPPVAISKAQILAMNGASGGDIDIVPAIPGKIIIVDSIRWANKFSGSAYAGGSDMKLRYGNAADGGDEILTLATMAVTWGVAFEGIQRPFFYEGGPGWIYGILPHVGKAVKLNVSGAQFSGDGSVLGTFISETRYYVVTPL